MANSKSSIREINLQNTSINLNKNKSIVSDFTGFNKNTGVWYNNALSNLWYKEEIAADNVFTIGEDIYKTKNGSLYKNDVLVKNYNDINKVSSYILSGLDENTIAYAPGVNIHIVGDNVYANDVLICEYDVNAIPYLVVNEDKWCIIYNKHFLSKGKTNSEALRNQTATTAIWSDTRNTWLVPLVVNSERITFFDPYTNITSFVDFGEINSLEGSFTLTNWKPELKLTQIDGEKIFASIVSYNIDENAAIEANGDVYEFRYLKGLIITDTTAEPYYSQEGDDINFITKMPDGYEYNMQATDQVKPLRSIETKFLQYHSMLTTAYSTICYNESLESVPANTGITNFDGITNFVWESLYTSNEKAEFMTLTGNTSEVATTVNEVKDKAYPRIFGATLDDNLTPQWLYTTIGKFKLIYNKDALVNISIDNSIICPWNDIDENSLTIVDDDIYYYSLNSNAWVHINVSLNNEIKCKVVGNKLLLNATSENCYDEDGDVFTYSVDSSYANITVGKPRMGFMNLLFLPYSNYYNVNDTTILRSWLQRLYDKQLEARKTLYYSIGRDTQLLTSEVGPIWATITTSYNDVKEYQSRNNINRFTVSGPFVEEIDLDKDWLFNNVYPSQTDELDIYLAEDTPTILGYYSTWIKNKLINNQKLQDTEKAFDEPTFYNLSPNIDIMSVIDGFNTIILIKTGNNTQQIIFKNGEPLLVYQILSGVSNISDYFVLQGQQYAIINGYINRIEMVNNGQVIAQQPITSVEGLKFLGNTDKQAFFFSQMNKTLLYFAADNTLEFLADATELDGNITSVFAKQTNDIFLILNNKVVVLTNSGSMFEIDKRAEWIVFGDKFWSDGEKVWSYYQFDKNQKRYPINIETLWYGDTVNRKLMEVDCIYVELFDENYTPGKFEISLDSLMNNTVSTKKQTFNIKSSDYDKMTKTIYLRFQPLTQNTSAFKLNINSDLPIKRLAVGYSTENIPLIAKNNI